MSGTRSAATKAPATDRPWRATTLVVAVHGIRGGPGCAIAHAAALHRRRLFREVVVGCHKGEPDLVEVVGNAPEGPVVIAPLLMAEAYTLRAMTRRLEDAAGRPFQVAPVLGTHPRFTDLILGEGLAGCTAGGWAPAETGLLLVGHGTRRDPNSGETTYRHAKRVRAAARFAEVAVGFLDQDPSIEEALSALPAARVVAVGLFMDRGEHGEEDIPALLAASGREAIYSGPVGVDPLVPDLILDQIRAAASRSLAA
jgi:sirohydrochlorin cobaltochelatase